MPRWESRFFVPLILEKAHALWAFEKLEETKSYEVEFSKEAVDFLLQSPIFSNTLVILSISNIIFKVKVRSMFFFFGSWFSAPFFPLTSRFDTFHFLDSKRNRRVWRPSNSAKNGLSGSYSSPPGCFGSWLVDVLRNGAGLETMWASTKDMSTRVFFSESRKTSFSKNAVYVCSTD